MRRWRRRASTSSRPDGATRTGDDPRWAAADFDDSGWMRIASTSREPSTVLMAVDGHRVVPAPGQTVARRTGAGRAGDAAVGRLRGVRRRSARAAPSATSAVRRGGAHTRPARPGGRAAARSGSGAHSSPCGCRRGRWPTAREPAGGSRRRLPRRLPRRQVEANVQADARDREHARNVALVTALTAIFATFGLLHLLYFWLRHSDAHHLWSRPTPSRLRYRSAANCIAKSSITRSGRAP